MRGTKRKNEAEASEEGERKAKQMKGEKCHLAEMPLDIVYEASYFSIDGLHVFIPHFRYSRTSVLRTWHD